MTALGNCGGIKWPAQQLNIIGKSTGFTFGCASTASGVQSVGMNANFDLQPVFQLGQSEVYENSEQLPQIEMTVSKALDGACPAYLLATVEATSPSLFGRTPTFCNAALSIYPCTLDSASGTPNAIMVASGMQVGSVGFSFSVDGPFTEDITLIGNDMVWKLGNGLTHPGLCSNVNPTFTDQLNTISVVGCLAANNATPPEEIQFREHMIFTPTDGYTNDQNGMYGDPDCTILPPDVYGISASGTNPGTDVAIQSISVSVDLNREDINCLGRRGPKNRTITLPITVTTDIEVISDYGHLVSATEYGVCTASGAGQCDGITNLQHRTIRIATCDGLRVYTGVKNKLASVSRTGGDTGGGNLSVTYSYQTYNTLVVMHEHDLNSSAAAWWAAREDYLIN